MSTGAENTVSPKLQDSIATSEKKPLSSPKIMNFELGVAGSTAAASPVIHVQASLKNQNHDVAHHNEGQSSPKGGNSQQQYQSPPGVTIGVTLPQVPQDGQTLNKSGSFGANQSVSARRRFPPAPPPAFGSKEDRPLNKLANQALLTPGPGTYKMQPDFISSKYDKAMDEGNSYVTKDNGHLNTRPQIYAAAKSSRDALFMYNSIENPGPGSYETNTSSFVDNTTIRGLRQKALNQSPSPRNQTHFLSNSPTLLANQLNQALLNQRQQYNDSQNQKQNNNSNQQYQYYQNGNGYVDDTSHSLLTNQSYDGLLNPRMKRLVSNGVVNQQQESMIGPGAYNVSDELIRKSPRSNIKFGISKTVREDPFTKKTTLPSVGPGSYEFWSKNIGHKIPNPTIPREQNNRSMIGNVTRKLKKPKNASIRDNFEEYSDDESQDGAASMSAVSVPGPGSYIKEYSTFGKTTAKSESFQFFGSGVERFRHPNGSNSINAFQNNLGPGSYNSTHMPQSIRQHIFQFAGSSSFMNSSRKPGEMFENNSLAPGPGEYNPIPAGLIDPIFKHFEPSRVAFKSKIDRFHVHDMKKPDPGRYDLPGAMSPNALIKNIPLASYRSGTKRELKFQIDADVPGIGVYNHQDYTSIGIQKIQGGAPNNFSLLAKKNTTLGMHSIDANLDRAIYAETSTPSNVGPGAYGGSKFKHINTKEKSPKRDSSNGALNQLSQQQNVFGNEKRFKDNKVEIPGPGSYADVNKWHKKTYNLKFLNVA